MAMTVNELNRELSRLIEAGRGSVPVYIGNFEPVGVVWIEDDSTQAFEIDKANGFLIEYS